jgi:hypothetical protein
VKKIGVVFLLLVAVLLLWLSFTVRPHARSMLPVQPHVTPAGQITNPPFAKGQARPVQSVLSTASQRVLVREQRQIEERVRNEWNTEISFYGRVLDQLGQPVQGASIDYMCNDLSPEGVTRYQSKSGSDGRFSITGVRGKFLHITVSKEGYLPSKSDRNTFAYAAGEADEISPDAKRPLEFHLRKLSTSPPALVHTEKRFKIPLNGTPVQIEPWTKEAIEPETGSIVFKYENENQGSPPPGRFNWQVTISVPNGGIVEGGSEFNFEAPETGYLPSLSVKQSADDPTWKMELDKEFFVELPSGLFGRIRLHVYGHNGIARLDSYLNTSRSRNLEASPAH